MEVALVSIGQLGRRDDRKIRNRDQILTLIIILGNSLVLFGNPLSADLSDSLEKCGVGLDGLAWG